MMDALTRARINIETKPLNRPIGEQLLSANDFVVLLSGLWLGEFTLCTPTTRTPGSTPSLPVDLSHRFPSQ